MASKKRILMKETETESDKLNNNIDISAVGSKNLKLSHHLPHDIIIYDILTRVPIEGVLTQIRCVSKQYSNLIYDPVFADWHSRHQGYNYPQGFLCHSVDYDDNDEDEGRSRLVFFDLHKMEERNIPFRPENDFLGKRIKVLCSLNGLVLMYCMDKILQSRNYRVYNPITGRSNILPELLEVAVISKKKCHFSLGYDSVVDKYKVVVCGYSPARTEYFCKIVTVGTVEGRPDDDAYDSWRDVIVPRPQYLFPEDYPPVFANGSLHWMMGVKDMWNLDGSTGIEPESESGILSLDVTRESFYTIRHPEGYSGAQYTLLAKRGSLCFVDHISNTQLKLWVLKADLENDHRKQKQYYEWKVECSIDMGHLQSALPFTGFQNDCYPFAILTHKIIFWSYVEDDDDENYVFKYYSYDIGMKQLDFIYEPTGNYPHWHVNTLTYI